MPNNRRSLIQLSLIALVIGLAAGTLHAKSYTAERFDSSIRVLVGGAIEVTETLVLRFVDGTFTEVFRELPTRRTDGIEVLAAGMDERELPFGKGVDRVEVRNGSQVKTTWRFAPTSDATHTFTLRYLVRGVVQQQDGNDVLEWRALPREHAYTIGSSSIEISAPAAMLQQPAVAERRVDDFTVDTADRLVRIHAQDIGRNGWIQLHASYPGGAIITEPPRWQQRQIRAQALAPRWVMGSIALGLAGFLVLVAIRQRYDAPRREPSSAVALEAPDQLPPALAGALASNGSVSAQHAMAALFSLADRGYLTVTEGASRLGQRTFTLKRISHGGHLAQHERALLDVVFNDKRGPLDTVELSKARNHLVKGFRAFRAAIEQELSAAGLIDADRRRIHKLYGRVSLVMIFVSLALLFGTMLLVDRFGPWPLLVPLGMFVAGISGFVFQGATTPLSNEGVRRRDRWLAYQKHLGEVARSRAHLRVDSPAHVLPVAVALGLASAWSKFIKSHPTATPAWFQAVSAAGDHRAFPAFIAAGTAYGHGGVAGGGVAGGGASGAH